MLAFGYAKDKDRVYYYGLGARTGCVRKADPASFVSLGDGYFGKDGRYVFCAFGALPKADPQSWTKIAGLYSQDSGRIYYMNENLRQADGASFAVVNAEFGLAKDKQRFYRTGKEDRGRRTRNNLCPVAGRAAAAELHPVCRLGTVLLHSQRSRGIAVCALQRLRQVSRLSGNRKSVTAFQNLFSTCSGPLHWPGGSASERDSFTRKASGRTASFQGWCPCAASKCWSTSAVPQRGGCSSPWQPACRVM
jgi:hypothetical protein